MVDLTGDKGYILRYIDNEYHIKSNIQRQ